MCNWKATGGGGAVKMVHGRREAPNLLQYMKFNSWAGCHVLYHDLNLLYCFVNSVLPVTGCPAVYSDWNQHYVDSVDC